MIALAAAVLSGGIETASEGSEDVSRADTVHKAAAMEADAAPAEEAGRRDSLLMVFWNLENFFDYFDDGAGTSDADFSAFGTRHWTKKRFLAKCNAFGKTILAAASEYGNLPALIGLAEIENRFVLRRIVSSDVLRKCGYTFVHYESPDRRGIDVALLYRNEELTLLCSRAVHIYDGNGKQMPTRDILYSEFVVRGKGRISDTLHIAVNHHPSKYSGSRASAAARNAAMAALRALCDSVERCSSAPVIMAGDFNDTPDGEQFRMLGGHRINLAAPLSSAGAGSIRFNGKWEMIDHFIVTAPADTLLKMDVFTAPFLLERDKAHTGEKPRRTYSGPRYAGGVSDHLPIVLLRK